MGAVSKKSGEEDDEWCLIHIACLLVGLRKFVRWFCIVSDLNHSSIVGCNLKGRTLTGEEDIVFGSALAWIQPAPL